MGRKNKLSQYIPVPFPNQKDLQIHRDHEVIVSLQEASTIQNQLKILGKVQEPSLYPLFLRWMLVEVPPSWRKALQSCMGRMDGDFLAERKAVWMSLLQSNPFHERGEWEKPLLSIDVALNWEPMSDLVVSDDDFRRDFVNTLEEYTTFVVNDIQGTLRTHMIELEQLIQVIKMLVLQFEVTSERFLSFMETLLPFVDFHHKTILGMLYGRLCDPSKIPDLVTLNVFKLAGLAAACPRHPGGLYEVLESIATTTTDHEEQLVALRGIVALSSHHRELDLSSRMLGLILRTWESSQSRRLHRAVVTLFQNWVKHQEGTDWVDALVQSILEMPVHAKSRYVALETLLPLLSESTSELEPICRELLGQIAIPGNNTAPIADLWVRTVSVVYGDSLAWIKDMSQHLLEGQISEAKQLLSFCISRFKFVSENVDPSCMCTELLKNVLLAQDANTRLWLILDIVRMTATEKLLSDELRHLVRSSISLASLKKALSHTCRHTQTSALLALTTVANCHHEQPTESLICEADVFESFIRIAAKRDGKEFKATVFRCMVDLVDRLLIAGSQRAENDSEVNSSALRFVQRLLSEKSMSFFSFPGRAAEKETFVMSMVEMLALYAFRDVRNEFDQRFISSRDQVWTRKRSSSELDKISHIQALLLGSNVMDALTDVLKSIWDTSRSNAFRLLVRLKQTAQANDQDTCGIWQEQHSLSSALTEAQSPRQREADTWSRVLAMQCLFPPSSTALTSRSSFDELVDFVGKSVERVKEYYIQLRSSAFAASSRFPMTNGHVRAAQLVLEYASEAFVGEHMGSINRLIEYCFEAVTSTLHLLADLKEGVTLDVVDSVDDELEIGTSWVNPGALGANGIFSSTRHVSQEEKMRRYQSQSLLIGSWLLTREACAFLSTAIMLPSVSLDTSVASKCATVLMDALVSLKHSGAAFAAHRTFSTLVAKYFAIDSAVPIGWTIRVLDEIVNHDRIHDSTLRRSTGFALAFLSIMRAEIKVLGGASKLAESILFVLLHLSFPSKNVVCTDELATVLPELRRFIDVDVSASPKGSLIREHTLNVLRLLIMDASLAKVTQKGVGIAIVSSLTGCTDESWSIRNSSTMVFSAVMLRAIDADKNGSQSELYNKATTITHLWQSFPFLPPFLLQTLNQAIANESPRDRFTLLPIVLLFSRIQPLRNGGVEASEAVYPFISPLFECLSQDDIHVRRAASNAIVNISPHADTKSSFVGILQDTLDNLNNSSWNRMHGVLLTVEALLESTQMKWFQIVSVVPNVSRPIVLCRRLQIPPACALLFLKILRLADDESDLLLDQCTSVLSLESSVTLQPFGAEMVAVASRIVTEILSASFWKGDENAMQRMYSLLRHTTREARYAAVKAFKKMIYAAMDKLSKGKEGKDSKKATVILPMAMSMLSDATRYELDSGAVHHPHLRRLTRCLIEVMSTSALLNVRLDVDSFRTLLTELFEMVAASSQFDDEAQTQMSGNTLELLSLVPGAVPTTNMIDLLERLSQQLCPWRVRHSAAVACHELLKVEPREPRVVRVYVELLQDHDEDVRMAASGNMLVEQALKSLLAEESYFGLAVDMMIGSWNQLQNAQVDSDAAFVDENPNAYGEPLLFWHHSVACFLRSDEEVYNSEKAITAGQQVIQRISEGISTSNAHSFSTIQGILVACAAIHWEGGGVVETRDASEVVHPLIRKIMSALKDIVPMQQSCRDSILDKCFLVDRA